MDPGTTQTQAARVRRERRQQRILAACLAGSLAAHLVAYAWVASRKPEPVARKGPSGFMMVEHWPAPRPPAAAGEAGKGAGEPVPSRAAPARTAGRTAPVQVDVAGEVQRKGILRALGSLGRGPMARGLPGAMAGGELPSGLPDAPSARVDGAGFPERRGEGSGAPAVLGDLGTGGGGGARGGGAGIGLSSGLGGSSIGIGTGQVGSAEVDQAKLDAFVRARIGGLRACYETQLKRDSRSDGTMRMRFAIRATGELSDVVASENSIASDVMADCLVRILRTWRTPFRPSEAVTVEYPFVFRPSRE